MRWPFILLALPGAVAAQSFDAQAKVTAAIAAVKPVALNTGTADWPAIEKRARAIAAEAKDAIDLLPAYAAITFGLRDGHSFVRTTPEMEAGWKARYGNRRLLPDEPRRVSPASPFSGRREPEGRSLPIAGGRAAALLVVPAVDWAQGDTSASYGNKLWALVARAAPRACGFVVDVRGNTGGDQWPMVTGLSPLIGDGHRFATVDGTGKLTVRARLAGAAAVPVPPSEEEPVINRISGWRPLPALAGVAVAVLTDAATASSGEGVVLAFSGRPNTRRFGGRTRGLASSNEVLEMGDGVRLFVTTALAADRLGRTFPDGILPDVTIAHGVGDPVLAAATRWLGTSRACGGRAAR